MFRLRKTAGNWQFWACRACRGASGCGRVVDDFGIYRSTTQCSRQIPWFCAARVGVAGADGAGGASRRGWEPDQRLISTSRTHAFAVDETKLAAAAAVIQYSPPPLSNHSETPP